MRRVAAVALGAVVLLSCEASAPPTSPSPLASSERIAPAGSATPVTRPSASAPALDARYGFWSYGQIVSETGQKVLDTSGLRGVSPDGGSGAYWDPDGTLIVVDIATGQKRPWLTLPKEQRGGNVQWSWDGSGVAAAGLSVAMHGGIPEGNLTVFTAVHLVDLASGSVYEPLMLERGRDAIVAWDRSTGDIALAAYRPSSTAPVEVVHATGVIARPNVSPCTAEADPVARAIVVLEPACIPIVADPDQPAAPRSRVVMISISTGMPMWSGQSDEGEIFLEARVRPFSGEVVVLVRERRGAGTRLEVWSSDGTSHRVLARLPGTNSIFPGQGILFFRPDGSGAFVRVGSTSAGAQYPARLVDMTSGAVAEIGLPVEARGAVVVDQEAASRLRARLTAVSPLALTYYRNDLLGYRLTLPLPYRRSTALSVYRIDPATNDPSETQDAFTARTVKDESGSTQACETVCWIFDYVATVRRRPNPQNVSPRVWAEDFRYSGGAVGQVVEDILVDARPAARRTNGPSGLGVPAPQVFVAVSGYMFEMTYVRYDIGRPPEASVAKLNEIVASFRFTESPAPAFSFAPTPIPAVTGAQVYAAMNAQTSVKIQIDSEGNARTRKVQIQRPDRASMSDQWVVPGHASDLWVTIGPASWRNGIPTAEFGVLPALLSPVPGIDLGPALLASTKSGGFGECQPRCEWLSGPSGNVTILFQIDPQMRLITRAYVRGAATSQVALTFTEYGVPSAITPP